MQQAAPALRDPHVFLMMASPKNQHLERTLMRSMGSYSGEPTWGVHSRGAPLQDLRGRRWSQPDSLHLFAHGGTDGLFLAKVKGISQNDQHDCIAHWKESEPTSQLWDTQITYSWCYRVSEKLCYTWYLLLAQKGSCSQMYEEIRVPEVARLCRRLATEIAAGQQPVPSLDPPLALRPPMKRSQLRDMAPGERATRRRRLLEHYDA
eukprot:s451_g15.t1